MSLTWVLDNVENRRWVDDTSAVIRESTQHPIGVDEAKQLFLELENSLQATDANDAANLLTACLAHAQEDVFERLRRRGLLRPSKRGFVIGLVRSALDLAMPALAEARVAPHVLDYLNSIANLCVVSATVKQFEDSLIDLFMHRGHPMLKRVIAKVELLFMVDTYLKQERGDRSRDSMDFLFWPREELADGLSYLIQLFYKHIGPYEPFWPVDDRQGAEGDCILALILACHVRTFQGWEIKVDAFEYQFLAAGEQAYVLRPPGPDFERCLKLGYILRQFGVHLSHRRVTERKDGVSLRDIAERLSRSRLNIATLRTRPLSRIRFEFPEILFKNANLLPGSGFFEEEVIQLEHFAGEWLVDIDEILDSEVCPNVQIRDIVRLQRVFRFIAYCMAHHLTDRLNKEPLDIAAYRSVVLIESADSFKNVMGAFVEADRLEDAFGCLHWDPASSAFLDILYQPILKWKDVVAIPAALLAQSNVIRNSIKISVSRQLPGDGEERFPRFVDEALASVTNNHAQGVDIHFEGQQAEIDNIARIGDLLFVIEVKAPIDPTGTHELRVSFDHIQKARIQLDRFLEFYRDPSFRPYLESRVGFSLDGITEVCTAISIANRMFVGYQVGAHPVIGAFDLAAFLRHGELSIGDEVKRLWQEERFAAEDFRAFANGELTYGPLKNAMAPITERYLFHEITVSVETFALDMIHAAQALGMNEAAAKIRRTNEVRPAPRAGAPNRRRERRGRKRQ